MSGVSSKSLICVMILIITVDEVSVSRCSGPQPTLFGFTGCEKVLVQIFSTRGQHKLLNAGNLRLNHNNVRPN